MSRANLRDVFARELTGMFNSGMNYMNDTQVASRDQIVGRSVERLATAVANAMTASASEFILKITPQKETVNQEVTPFVEAILKDVGIVTTTPPTEIVDRRQEPPPVAPESVPTGDTPERADDV